jgi:hypothetical protein
MAAQTQRKGQRCHYLIDNVVFFSLPWPRRMRSTLAAVRRALRQHQIFETNRAKHAAQPAGKDLNQAVRLYPIIRRRQYVKGKQTVSALFKPPDSAGIVRSTG